MFLQIRAIFVPMWNGLVPQWNAAPVSRLGTLGYVNILIWSYIRPKNTKLEWEGRTLKFLDNYDMWNTAHMRAIMHPFRSLHISRIYLCVHVHICITIIKRIRVPRLAAVTVFHVSQVRSTWHNFVKTWIYTLFDAYLHPFQCLFVHWSMMFTYIWAYLHTLERLS